MYVRKSYQEKLAEIAREYEKKVTNEEWVQSRLRWEDWETLRKDTVAFARGELRKRRWRGARSGVLPTGDDAEGVADQAIAELLGGNCRLMPGFLRSTVQKELERLVKDRIRRLHGLKEARAMRSEWEVLPADEEGNRKSVFPAIVDENAGRAAEEEKEVRERAKREFEDFLDGEEELKGLFRCLGEGITKPSEIARRLGIDEQEAVRARKRLDRRMAEFGRRTRE
jgi:hypothetical protein